MINVIVLFFLYYLHKYARMYCYMYVAYNKVDVYILKFNKTYRFHWITSAII